MGIHIKLRMKMKNLLKGQQPDQRARLVLVYLYCRYVMFLPVNQLTDIICLIIKRISDFEDSSKSTISLSSFLNNLIKTKLKQIISMTKIGYYKYRCNI